VFSIVCATMGDGKGGLLPCCGESLSPCSATLLEKRHITMISLLGNQYSTVKIVETPAPLSSIFIIFVFIHPMICISSSLGHVDAVTSFQGL
jgi:hypothetical protein